MKKLFPRLTPQTFGVIMLILTLTIITLVPKEAYAREESTIKKIRGEGISFQLDDEREVRATAIDDALKKAVTNAYDSLVDQTDASFETKMLKDSVLSAPLNYILDYRVISQGWIRHLVIEPGLPVPPADELSTFPSSQMNSAKIAIDGMPNISRSSLDGTERPVDAFTPQEQGLRLYHVWIEASIDFKELKSDLALTPSYEGLNTSLVTILLITITDYKTFSSLKGAIEKLDSVKEVTLDSFLKGKIVLTAEVWGNPHELLEKLKANKNLHDLDIIPSGVDRIIIKGVINK